VEANASNASTVMAMRWQRIERIVRERYAGYVSESDLALVLKAEPKARRS
jgi:hypothetical protein